MTTQQILSALNTVPLHVATEDRAYWIVTQHDPELEHNQSRTYEYLNLIDVVEDVIERLG